MLRTLRLPATVYVATGAVDGMGLGLNARAALIPAAFEVDD